MFVFCFQVLAQALPFFIDLPVSGGVVDAATSLVAGARLLRRVHAPSAAEADGTSGGTALPERDGHAAEIIRQLHGGTAT